MYKIVDVEILGFWGEFRAYCSFEENVNVIIGTNGTGKTTFMNILNSVLSVDVVGLGDNEFESILIRLCHARSNRTIKVARVDDGPYPLIRYQIATKVFELPLVGIDDFRGSMFRRRAFETAQNIKTEIQKIIALASLSVYRYRVAGDLDTSDRGALRKVHGPVDARLQELMLGLTKYQLELSQKAREISVELQRDVLMSLLYQPGVEGNQKGFVLSHNAEQEKTNLTSAYKQLGLSGSKVSKRINEHVKAVEEAVATLRSLIDDENGDKKRRFLKNPDLAPLEASRRVSKVYELSLEAEKRTNILFSQVNLFIEKLGDFIKTKKFGFDGGSLVIKEPRKLTVSKLSSGEKQLVILLTEALLQKREPYIFLADEPELSLHIEWQRKVIPAVKSLNPNAQVIVATHSPEVASRYKDFIKDMEDILHVKS